MIRDEIAQLDRERSQLTIPDLLKDLFWYNTRPLSFEQDLKGKIVLFDFWTYCCINCLHVLPDLNYLENKFKDCPFVVIGVHSAKFANEKSENNLEANIRKLHIKHPIVNDPELSFWHALGIHSWPSFALMGPFGNLLFTTSGEGKRDLLEEWIEESLSFYQKDLIYTALPQQLTKTHPHTLKYPTRLAEDPLSSLLWISDSGNNRVIGVNRQTVIKEEFAGTHFNGPQGLLWFQNQLYVADTDHHVLQKIDLATKTVETILGTYTQGFDYVGGGIGPNQPISSPWALALAEDESGLYIAMAGTHQIWFYQFSTKRGFAISGSGHERMLDGPALKAGWAQPSGLSIGAWNHDEHLFVADSESSSIRALLPQKKRVITLSGGDPLNPHNLFHFGDRSGLVSGALYQHPLDVLFVPQERSVFVADTYNHRIKVILLDEGRVEVFAGTGKPGWNDGAADAAQFWEPSGLTLAKDGRFLWVADTNNHAIRQIDLKTRETSTWMR